MAPGVAYLRLHGFQGDRAQYDSLLARLRFVLDSFDSARTLIIDARQYLGGALDETDAMASYFFARPVDGPVRRLPRRHPHRPPLRPRHEPRLGAHRRWSRT